MDFGKDAECLTQVIALQVLKDISLRQMILKAQKFESISVGVVQFFHLMGYEA